MGATKWLTGRWLARRWVAVLPVALIVAAGGAATMVALSASVRTSNAYGDYVDRADVGDMVINPAMATQEIADVIRGLPGVERVTTSALLTASWDVSGPITPARALQFDSIADSATFVLGSSDGRYFDMDRPAVHAGRMPTGHNEAAVTRETSAAHDIHIGDVLPMSFWQFGLPDGLAEEARQAYLETPVSPIGVEQVTIVGIVSLADEALPDELFPRQRLVVSPDIATKYDCLPDEPSPGLTLAENVAILIPAECAFAQHYFSVELAGGADAVKPALDEFVRIAEQRNTPLRDNITDLAEFPDDFPPQYYLIPTETQGDIERAEDATRPTAASLLMLSLVTGVLSVALAGLVVWRDLQRTISDQQQWFQLGMTASSRTFVVALPACVATVAGALVAPALAWAFDLGPQGVIATIEPHAERRLVAAAVLALVAIVAAVLLIVAGLAWSMARRAQRSLLAGDVRRGGRGLALRRGGPVLTEGVRGAYQRRSAVPVIAGVTIAMATFVAALTFGSSLGALISTPARFGWTWDVASITNAGYGNLDVERAHQLLDDDPQVERWSYYGFANEISLDGEPIASMIDPGADSTADISVIDGVLPVAADEVALGVTTASDRDLEVGDTVELAFVEPRQATVTAIVVLPTLGPFGSDRVSAGTGLVIPWAYFELPEFDFFRDQIAGRYAFVGIDLVDGIDHGQATARLEAAIGGLARDQVRAVTYSQPVRPAAIVDVEDTRALPRAFGTGFAVVAAIGLALASYASVRARRRHLAVLQSLGFDDAQVRRTVLLQSVATVLPALLIGVPVGVIAGRGAWRAFAGSLGVVPDPTTSVPTIVAVVIGGVVVAVLAAAIPARLATRVTPADGLRAE